MGDAFQAPALMLRTAPWRLVVRGCRSINVFEQGNPVPIGCYERANTRPIKEGETTS